MVAEISHLFAAAIEALAVVSIALVASAAVSRFIEGITGK